MDYLQVRNYCFYLILRWLRDLLCVAEDNIVVCNPSAMDNTVLLKKFAGEEGEGVDVQKLFGYIGLFTLVALWWLGILTSSILLNFYKCIIRNIAYETGNCCLLFKNLWFLFVCYSVAIDSIRDRTQVYHSTLCQS